MRLIKEINLCWTQFTTVPLFNLSCICKVCLHSFSGPIMPTGPRNSFANLHFFIREITHQFLRKKNDAPTILDEYFNLADSENVSILCSNKSKSDTHPTPGDRGVKNKTETFLP